jgi:hypothetical protein
MACRYRLTPVPTAPVPTVRRTPEVKPKMSRGEFGVWLYGVPLRNGLYETKHLALADFDDLPHHLLEPLQVRQSHAAFLHEVNVFSASS